MIIISLSSFVLFNLDKRRILSSLSPHAGYEKDLQDMEKMLGTVGKIDVLRTFMRSTIGPIFPDIFVPNPYAVDQASGGK